MHTDLGPHICPQPMGLGRNDREGDNVSFSSSLQAFLIIVSCREEVRPFQHNYTVWISEESR